MTASPSTTRPRSSSPPTTTAPVAVAASRASATVSVIFVGPDTNRDVIVRYIVEQGTIDPSADANWSFAPMPGTSVVFETGPRAKDYVGQVKGAAPEFVEDTEDGFARFRLRL